jgi:hypothetical protein
MPLTGSYVLPVNRIPDVFSRIRDGQAPERFTHQLLKDWGFKSTNDRAFIGLLKELGFLSPDGQPTQRYLAYRDHSRSKQIMATASREAYADLFLIKEHPSANDKATIEGKFKSFHNTSDNVANLMAKTFFALLPLADHSSPKQQQELPPNDNKFEIPEFINPPSDASTNGRLFITISRYTFQQRRTSKFTMLFSNL